MESQRYVGKRSQRINILDGRIADETPPTATADKPAHGGPSVIDPLRYEDMPFRKLPNSVAIRLLNEAIGPDFTVEMRFTPRDGVEDDRAYRKRLDEVVTDAGDKAAVQTGSSRVLDAIGKHLRQAALLMRGREGDAA